MRCGPHTAENVATGIATVGAGIAGSSLPGGAAVGGAIQAVGTFAGGHVVAAAAPIIAATAPFVVGGAIAFGVGCAIGAAINKFRS